MIDLVKGLASPLISFAILTISASFMTTYLGMLTKEYTGDEWLVGAMMSATYAGMVLGAFKLEGLARRIGHIRMFATFASLMGAVALLHGLYFSEIFWIILRFVAGLSLAGLYMVIEGWLLANSTERNRAQILSIYMVSLYVSQSIGQILLRVTNFEQSAPFLLMGLMACLSVIPIALTKAKTPDIQHSSILKVSKLYKLSPSGVVGCFLAGMVMSVIYGLTHSYLRDIDQTANIPNIMTAIILGGATLQYPIGLVSDRYDKRFILFGLISVLTLASGAILLMEGYVSSPSTRALYFMLFFLFGGASFTLYTINIAHACDYISSQEILAAIAGLLLAYGVGATVGPLVAPLFTALLGPDGFLIYFMVISGILGWVYLYRGRVRPSKPVEEQINFIPVVSTTPMVHQLSSVVQETQKQEEEQKKEKDKDADDTPKTKATGSGG